MYKVFFDQKQIILLEENYSSILNDSEKHLFHSEEKLKSVIFDFLHNSDKSILYIFCEDVVGVMKSFINLYECRITAGGVVRDEKNRILLIFRKGKWDLPKGHMDEGETPLQTAVRETIEETGVENLVAGNRIGDTWHLYYLKGRLVLKRSVWYEMKADSATTLSPQLEEDITEAKWADPLDLPHLYKNTYLSIAELLTYYLNEKRK